MKILLIGANGQLGSDLQLQLPKAGHSVTPVTRASLDICNRDQMRSAIGSLRPDLVINTAAFHNVELCEDEPEQAFNANAVAVRNLALACAEHGCELVHFSTDFVFDGKQSQPYTETDLPHPLSVYAASKLAGEHLAALSLDRHYIIRTCGLYGAAGSASRGGNFVDKVLKRASSGEPVRVVDDQILTPTFTDDLAQAVVSLITTTKYGLYHITNEGQCSWYEFACKAIELRGIKADIQPQSTAALKPRVKRPSYSVLSKEKLYAVGLPKMPHWQDALARYLRR